MAKTLTQHFLATYKAAGADGTSSHSGRRTYTTQVASKGTSLRVLMRLTRHHNVSTTAVYIDANDKMLWNAVELV